jgi:hypothetical protein
VTVWPIDYRRKVSVPIRDIRTMKVEFVVDVYGLTPRDLYVIPGGSAPMREAVKRLGLDPNIYQAVLWDIL